MMESCSRALVAVVKTQWPQWTHGVIGGILGVLISILVVLIVSLYRGDSSPPSTPPRPSRRSDEEFEPPSMASQATMGYRPPAGHGGPNLEVPPTPVPLPAFPAALASAVKHKATSVVVEPTVCTRCNKNMHIEATRNHELYWRCNNKSAPGCPCPGQAELEVITVTTLRKVRPAG